MNNLAHRNSRFYPFSMAVIVLVIVSFLTSMVGPLPSSYAQPFSTPGVGHTGSGIGLGLPAPGTMVFVSPAFSPPVIKGIKVYPDRPFKFDFIVDTGDAHLSGEDLKGESQKLIKYFLASLAVAEKDLWVNLSPYEKDRIIPDGFGTTEMGRDLLAQDYLLKQLTASLVYPENEPGKVFWERIRRKTRETYGDIEISSDTFNKVWIVPETAAIFENGSTAFVTRARLKVMMEEDYVALFHSQRSQVTSHRSQDRQRFKAAEDMQDDNATPLASRAQRGEQEVSTSQLQTTLLKELILPEIEKEINEGENFARLRQIYYSVILAAWYKRRLRKSFLGQSYVDQGKVKGIDSNGAGVNRAIYEQYLDAYRQGVYNYIREDDDPESGQAAPRKYFSGGTQMAVDAVLDMRDSVYDVAMVGDGFKVAAAVESVRGAMVVVPQEAAWIQTVNQRLEMLKEGGRIDFDETPEELLLTLANHLEKLDARHKEVRQQIKWSISYYLTAFMRRMKSEYPRQPQAMQKYWAKQSGVSDKIFSKLKLNKYEGLPLEDIQARMAAGLGVPSDELSSQRPEERLLQESLWEGKRLFNTLLLLMYDSYGLAEVDIDTEDFGITESHLQGALVATKFFAVPTIKKIAVKINQEVRDKNPNAVLRSAVHQQQFALRREIEKVVGAEVRSIRERFALSIDDVAQKSGVSEHAISQFERGAFLMGDDNMVAVLRILKTSPDRLKTSPNIERVVNRNRKLADGLQKLRRGAQKTIRSLHEKKRVSAGGLVYRDFIKSIATLLYDLRLISPEHLPFLAEGFGVDIQELWPETDLVFVTFGGRSDVQLKDLEFAKFKARRTFHPRQSTWLSEFSEPNEEENSVGDRENGAAPDDAAMAGKIETSGSQGGLPSIFEDILSPHSEQLIPLLLKYEEILGRRSYEDAYTQEDFTFLLRRLDLYSGFAKDKTIKDIRDFLVSANEQLDHDLGGFLGFLAAIIDVLIYRERQVFTHSENSDFAFAANDEFNVLNSFLERKDADDYVQQAKEMFLRGQYVPFFLFSDQAYSYTDGSYESYHFMDLWRYENIIAPRVIEADKTRFSLGAGPRQLLAYRMSLEDLAKEAQVDPSVVMARQTIIVNINETDEDAVLRDFIRNNYYGFNLENVYFVTQPSEGGYRFSQEGRLVYQEKSPQLRLGDGHSLGQLAEKRQAFRLRLTGKKEVLSSSLLEVLDDKISIGTHPIGDFSHFLKDRVLDMNTIAFTLWAHKRGNHHVVRLLYNPDKGEEFENYLVKNIGSGELSLLDKARAFVTMLSKHNVTAENDRTLVFNGFRHFFQAKYLKALLEKEYFTDLRFHESGLFYLNSRIEDMLLPVGEKTVLVGKRDEEFHDIAGDRTYRNLSHAMTSMAEQDELLRRQGFVFRPAVYSRSIFAEGVFDGMDLDGELGIRGPDPENSGQDDLEMTGVTAELQPDWLPELKEAIRDRLAHGRSLADAVKGLSRNPRLFPDDEPRFERARRWLIMDEKKSSVKVCYLAADGQWYQQILRKDESGALKELAVAFWSDEEKETLERTMAAMGSFIHQTRAIVPYLGSFLLRGNEVGKFSNDIKYMIKDLSSWAGNQGNQALKIIGFTRLVLQNDLDQWNDRLRTILVEIERIKSMIHALDRTRREMGTRRLKEVIELMMPFYQALQDLVSGGEITDSHEVKDTLALLKKGIEKTRIEKDGKSLDGVRVRGSIGSLGLLLENLVENAWVWASTDSPRVTVKASYDEQAGQVIISVRDNGAGGGTDVAAWENPLLGASGRKGHGVGLPLIRYLTEDLGGTLGVESQVGKGTTVTLSIPAVSSNAMAMADPAMSAKSGDSDLAGFRQFRSDEIGEAGEPFREGLEGIEDITWEELRAEGYDVMVENLFNEPLIGGEKVPRVIIARVTQHGDVLKRVDARGQEDPSFIVLYVYPSIKWARVGSFSPQFHRPVSEEDKRGRGRAVLRHLLNPREYGGYSFFVKKASPGFEKSILRMSDYHPRSFASSEAAFDQLQKDMRSSRLEAEYRQSLENALSGMRYWDLTFGEVPKAAMSTPELVLRAREFIDGKKFMAAREILSQIPDSDQADAELGRLKEDTRLKFYQIVHEMRRVFPVVGDTVDRLLERILVKENVHDLKKLTKARNMLRDLDVLFSEVERSLETVVGAQRDLEGDIRGILQVAYEEAGALDVVIGKIQLLVGSLPEIVEDVSVEVRRGEPLSSTRDVRKLIESGDRLRGFFNELLNESFEVPKTSIDVMDVLERTAMTAKVLYENIKLEIRHSPESGPLVISGVKDSLVRIFLNLINNSVEAKADSKIEISVRRQDSEIVIEYRDNGPGIPEGNLARIFDLWFTAGKEGGTGLGLPIARKIIEDHGGSIDAAGRKGEGVLFTIELPLIDTDSAMAGGVIDFGKTLDVYLKAHPGKVNFKRNVNGPVFVDARADDLIRSIIVNAFDEQKEGKISVKLQEQGEQLLFSVSNSGEVSRLLRFEAEKAAREGRLVQLPDGRRKIIQSTRQEPQGRLVPLSEARGIALTALPFVGGLSREKSQERGEHGRFGADLFTVYGLVQELGGSIEMISAGGRTTVRVYLNYSEDPGQASAMFAKSESSDSAGSRQSSLGEIGGGDGETVDQQVALLFQPGQTSHIPQDERQITEDGNLADLAMVNKDISKSWLWDPLFPGLSSLSGALQIQGMIRKTIEISGVDPGKFKGNILVVGFNKNANELLELARQFPAAEIIGVEWVPKRKKIVEKKMKSEPRDLTSRVTLYNKDARDLNDVIKDGSIGIVFFSDVFNQFELNVYPPFVTEEMRKMMIRGLLEESRRVLKPGGIMTIVGVPFNRVSKMIADFSFKKLHPGNGELAKAIFIYRKMIDARYADTAMSAKPEDPDSAGSRQSSLGEIGGGGNSQLADKTEAAGEAVEAWTEAFYDLRSIVSTYRDEKTDERFREFARFALQYLDFPEDLPETGRWIRRYKPLFVKENEDPRALRAALNARVWFLWFVARGHEDSLRDFIDAVKREGWQAVVRHEKVLEQRRVFHEVYAGLGKTAQGDVTRRDDKELGFNVLINSSFVIDNDEEAREVARYLEEFLKEFDDSLRVEVFEREEHRLEDWFESGRADLSRASSPQRLKDFLTALNIAPATYGASLTVEQFYKMGEDLFEELNLIFEILTNEENVLDEWTYWSVFDSEIALALVKAIADPPDPRWADNPSAFRLGVLWNGIQREIMKHTAAYHQRTPLYVVERLRNLIRRPGIHHLTQAAILGTFADTRAERGELFGYIRTEAPGLLSRFMDDGVDSARLLGNMSESLSKMEVWASLSGGPNNILLRGLDARQKRILLGRFKLGLTFEEIGGLEHRTGERVRQLEERALEDLGTLLGDPLGMPRKKPEPYLKADAGLTDLPPQDFLPAGDESPKSLQRRISVYLAKVGYLSDGNRRINARVRRNVLLMILDAQLKPVGAPELTRILTRVKRYQSVARAIIYYDINADERLKKHPKLQYPVRYLLGTRDKTSQTQEGYGSVEDRIEMLWTILETQASPITVRELWRLFKKVKGYAHISLRLVYYDITRDDRLLGHSNLIFHRRSGSKSSIRNTSGSRVDGDTAMLSKVSEENIRRLFEIVPVSRNATILEFGPGEYPHFGVWALRENPDARVDFLEKGREKNLTELALLQLQRNWSLSESVMSRIRILDSRDESDKLRDKYGIITLFNVMDQLSAFYRDIIPVFLQRLKPGGRLFVSAEIDSGEFDDRVRFLVREAKVRFGLNLALIKGQGRGSLGVAPVTNRMPVYRADEIASLPAPGPFSGQTEQIAESSPQGSGATSDAAMVNGQPKDGPNSLYDGIDVRNVLVIHSLLNGYKGEQIIWSQLPDLIAKKFPDARIHLLNDFAYRHTGRNFVDATRSIRTIRADDGIETWFYHKDAMEKYLADQSIDVVFNLGDISALFGTRQGDPLVPLVINRESFYKKGYQGSVRPRVLTEDSGNYYDEIRQMYELWGLDTSEGFFPEWEASPEEQAWARGILKTNGIQLDRPVILLNDNASAEDKELSTDGWSRLLGSLKARDFPFTDYYFVIDRGHLPRHQAKSSAIAEKLKTIYAREPGSPRYEPLLPKLSLEELVKVLSGTHGVFTIDTLMGHLGPALEKPTFVLFPQPQKNSRARWLHPNAQGIEIDRQNPDIGRVADEFTGFVGDVRRQWERQEDPAMAVRQNFPNSGEVAPTPQSGIGGAGKIEEDKLRADVKVAIEYLSQVIDRLVSGSPGESHQWSALSQAPDAILSIFEAVNFRHPLVRPGELSEELLGQVDFLVIGNIIDDIVNAGNVSRTKLPSYLIDQKYGRDQLAGNFLQYLLISQTDADDLLDTLWKYAMAPGGVWEEFRHHGSIQKVNIALQLHDSTALFPGLYVNLKGSSIKVPHSFPLVVKSLEGRVQVYKPKDIGNLGGFTDSGGWKIVSSFRKQEPFPEGEKIKFPDQSTKNEGFSLRRDEDSIFITDFSGDGVKVFFFPVLFQYENIIRVHNKQILDKVMEGVLSGLMRHIPRSRHLGNLRIWLNSNKVIVGARLRIVGEPGQLWGLDGDSSGGEYMLKRDAIVRVDGSLDLVAGGESWPRLTKAINLFNERVARKVAAAFEEQMLITTDDEEVLDSSDVPVPSHGSDHDEAMVASVSSLADDLSGVHDHSGSGIKSPGTFNIDNPEVFIWDALQAYVDDNPRIKSSGMAEAALKIAGRFTLIVDRIPTGSSLARGTSLAHSLREKANKEEKSALRDLAKAFADHVDKTVKYLLSQKSRLSRDIADFPDHLDEDDFQDILMELRAGRPQKSVLEETGISARSLYNWENGVTVCQHLGDLIKLANAHKTAISYFFGRESGEYVTYEPKMLAGRIGYHIQRIRMAKNFQRNKFAESIGMTVKVLENLERARVDFMEVDNWVRIAKGLNLFPEQLLRFPLILEELPPETVEYYRQWVYLPADGVSFVETGKRLRNLRGSQDRVAVARETGIHFKRIQSIENGHIGDTEINNIIKLAHYYGRTPFYVVTGQESVPTYYPIPSEVRFDYLKQNILRLRNHWQLSKYALGKRAGISDYTVGLAEKGGNIRLNTFVKIARALRVPVEILLSAPDWVERYIEEYLSPVADEDRTTLSWDLFYIGTLLREYRMRRRLTREDVANYLKVSPEVIEAIESGQPVKDSLRLLFEIAACFGVPVFSLLNGRLIYAAMPYNGIYEYAMVERYMGKKLERIMDTRGITASMLASALQVDRRTIYRILKGEKASTDVFVRLLKVLDVSIEELVVPTRFDIQDDFLNALYHLGRQEGVLSLKYFKYNGAEMVIDMIDAVFIAGQTWEEAWEEILTPHGYPQKDLPYVKKAILAILVSFNLVEIEGKDTRLTPWRVSFQFDDEITGIPESRGEDEESSGGNGTADAAMSAESGDPDLAGSRQILSSGMGGAGQHQHISVLGASKQSEGAQGVDGRQRAKDERREDPEMMAVANRPSVSSFVSKIDLNKDFRLAAGEIYEEGDESRKISSTEELVQLLGQVVRLKLPSGTYLRAEVADEEHSVEVIGMHVPQYRFQKTESMPGWRIRKLEKVPLVTDKVSKPFLLVRIKAVEGKYKNQGMGYLVLAPSVEGVKMVVSWRKSYDNPRFLILLKEWESWIKEMSGSSGLKNVEEKIFLRAKFRELIGWLGGYFYGKHLVETGSPRRAYEEMYKALKDIDPEYERGPHCFRLFRENLGMRNYAKVYRVVQYIDQYRARGLDFPERWAELKKDNSLFDALRILGDDIQRISPGNSKEMQEVLLNFFWVEEGVAPKFLFMPLLFYFVCKKIGFEINKKTVLEFLAKSQRGNFGAFINLYEAAKMMSLYALVKDEEKFESVTERLKWRDDQKAAIREAVGVLQGQGMDWMREGHSPQEVLEQVGYQGDIDQVIASLSWLKELATSEFLQPTNLERLLQELKFGFRFYRHAFYYKKYRFLKDTFGYDPRRMFRHYKDDKQADLVAFIQVMEDLHHFEADTNFSDVFNILLIFGLVEKYIGTQYKIYQHWLVGGVDVIKENEALIERGVHSDKARVDSIAVLIQQKELGLPEGDLKQEIGFYVLEVLRGLGLIVGPDRKEARVRSRLFNGEPTFNFDIGELAEGLHPQSADEQGSLTRLLAEFSGREGINGETKLLLLHVLAGYPLAAIAEEMKFSWDELEAGMVRVVGFLDGGVTRVDEMRDIVRTEKEKGSKRNGEENGSDPARSRQSLPDGIIGGNGDRQAARHDEGREKDPAMAGEERRDKASQHIGILVSNGFDAKMARIIQDEVRRSVKRLMSTEATPSQRDEMVSSLIEKIKPLKPAGKTLATYTEDAIEIVVPRKHPGANLRERVAHELWHHFRKKDILADAYAELRLLEEDLITEDEDIRELLERGLPLSEYEAILIARNKRLYSSDGESAVQKLSLSRMIASVKDLILEKIFKAEHGWFYGFGEDLGQLIFMFTNQDARLSYRILDVMDQGLSLQEAVSQNSDQAILAAASLIDQAHSGTETRGGIDLNPENINFDAEVAGDTAMMSAPFPEPGTDDTAIEGFVPGEIEGLVPVIYSITPIQSVMPFLGMAEREDTLEVSRL